MSTTNCFDRVDTRAEAEILKNQVIIKNDNCGKRGCMEYGQHHSMAITALDIKFGVAKRFFSVIHEGKFDLGDTNCKNIRAMFCANTDNIKIFK